MESLNLYVSFPYSSVDLITKLVFDNSLIDSIISSLLILRKSINSFFVGLPIA